LRFRAGVPVSEVLEVCRPFLAASGAAAPPGVPAPVSDAFGALPGAVPSGLPPLIGSIEPPEASGPDSLTLIGDRVPLKVRENLVAALVLAEGDAASAAALAAALGSGHNAVLAVRSLHAALAALLAAFSDRFQRPEPFPGGPGNLVSPTAVVDGCLEGGVTVGAGACIGSGTYIGSGTRIGPNAILHAHCRIGRDCVIQAGAVIGSEGFGFYPDDRAFGGHAAMPHPAGVEIGDGCWIGANTVIASGVLAPTTLGRGCKIDSLVQIAHNVRIGEGAQIASQCGIAGSTVVGKRFRMGGSAGLNGHIRIGDDVSVAAFSGVTKDLPDGVTVAGFPAVPIREWRLREIRLKQGR
jgi:UDP-3-O-[3-hydroxymyristoyl] glucosamine N-acyltransferase